MTDRSVTHGSFTIEREYGVPPSRVFAAWSERDAKNEWFGEGDTDFLETTTLYTLDFHVGGVERLEGKLPSGREFVYTATHQDIVQDERIVMTYDCLVDGTRISVSLMTVELSATPTGTKLVSTECGVYLDGHDTNEMRIEGATASLDHLSRYIERTSAPVSSGSR